MNAFSLQLVLTVLLGSITITGITIAPAMAPTFSQSTPEVILTAVPPITDLETAWALWKTQDIRSYVFAYRDHPGGWHRDVRVRVEEGVIVEIAVSLDCDTSTHDTSRCVLETTDLSVYTVDGVFNEIVKRMSGDAPTTERDHLDFSGDGTYGVPRKVVFDHPAMVDEEWQIMGLDFRVIEPLTGQRSLFPITPAIAVMLHSESAPRSDAAEIVPITTESAVQMLALQEAWSEAQPDEYVIILDYDYFFGWRFQVALQVRNSIVTAVTAVCGPGGFISTCSLSEFEASDYTIEGLFRAAQEVIESGLIVDDFIESRATLGLDPEYDFPTVLLYDIAGTADEEWAINVSRFAVLKK